MDWETLKTDCLACQRCPLHTTRHNVVFGQGVENAEVLFVGEGPGQSEDEQGLPFVGRSGQLLDKYLFAIDLNRASNCYIANIVKCRPPQNRDPLPAESEACMPWLRALAAIPSLPTFSADWVIWNVKAADLRRSQKLTVLPTITVTNWSRSSIPMQALSKLRCLT